MSYTPMELIKLRPLIKKACSFSKGVCAMQRATNSGVQCCKHCNLSEGYLNDAVAEQSKKQYKWDDKTGFLTSSGCSIPWRQRSFTCKSFLCGAAFKNLGSEEKWIFEEYREIAGRKRLNRK